MDHLQPKSDGIITGSGAGFLSHPFITTSTFTAKPDPFKINSETKSSVGTPRPIFHFGNQKSDVDKSKTEFNFVFEPTTSSLNTKSNNCAIKNNLNSEISKLKTPSSALENDSSSSKELNLDKKLEEKANSNFEIEESNERKEKEINKHKVGSNEEKETVDEGIAVKMFTQFTKLINGVIKERVENERRIMKLEKRVEALEKENALKNVKENNSSATEANHNYIFGTIPTLTSSNPPNFVYGTTVFPIMAPTMLPHQVPPIPKIQSVAKPNVESVIPGLQPFNNSDAHSHIEKEEHKTVENSEQHKNKKEKEESLYKSVNLKELFARLYEVISESEKVWANEGNKASDKEAS